MNFFARAFSRWKQLTPRALRKIIIAVLGLSVLLVGVAMIVLPGPAFIVIPLGLSILATEFVLARRILNNAKAWWKRQSFFDKSKAAECGGAVASAQPPKESA